MIGEGTRQLDLYDFFSIFMPGATLLIGLLPFFPKEISLPTSAQIAIFVILGFVFGRGIHAIRLYAETDVGATSHREQFINEVINPTYITDDLADQFYNCCQEQFDDISLPGSRSSLNYNSHADDLNMLYSLIRSHIHIDARGRSRTFQAVLDFYGSIWIVSFILAYWYMGYAFFKVIGIPNSIIGYTSYIGGLDIHFSIIYFAATFALAGAYRIFKDVRSDYRNYYIQYFLSDFVVLQKQSE